MSAGLTTTNLSPTSLADAVLVNRNGNSMVQPINALATQLVATGPLAARLGEIAALAGGVTRQLAPVSCATDAPIALAGEQTIDGIATAGSRVLVKDQASPAQNGIYVSAAGAWARADDMNLPDEFLRSLVAVTGGSAGAGRIWVCTSAIGTVDTDPVTWLLVQDVSSLIADRALKSENLADLGNIQKARENLDLDQIRSGVAAGLPAEMLIAFVTEALERTWLEVLTTTLGPSPLAVQRLTEAFASNDDYLAFFGQRLAAAGIKIERPDVDDIAFSFTFESAERTWLEVRKDGSLTAYAAGEVLRSLDMVSLTSTQVSALKAILGVGTVPESVTVTTPPPPAVLSTSPQTVGREFPGLIKLASNPVAEIADQSASHMLWPWLIHTGPDGGDRFCLFYSTDHATHAASGIFLLSTDDIENGTWTDHGLVFRDDSAGAQCETPAVMWDEANARWLMYYQMQKLGGALPDIPCIAGQVTMVATAPVVFNEGGAPATWTKIGVALDVPNIQSMGQSHTGYFTPFRYCGVWYGYSLFGGGDSSRGALWYSEDGVTWDVDPRPLVHGTPLTTRLPGQDETWVISRHSLAVLERQGGIWLVGMAAPPLAGGLEGATRIVAMPVADDLRSIGRPVDITPPLQGWEAGHTDFRINGALAWNGKTYVAYRSGGAQGGFGLMEVV